LKRWLRIGLQTAFGLFLLWLWLRTVSLPEVASHARVQSWPAVGLMICLFLVTSVIRVRRWLLLVRPLAPVGANQATGERAFEWARRFDWERHIEILERAVLEVARARERGATGFADEASIA